MTRFYNTQTAGLQMFGIDFSKKRTLEKSKATEIEIAQLRAKCAAAQFQLEALNRSQAMIEFDPTGIIQFANDNFLTCLGYRLDEIVGKHHRIFLPKSEVESPQYAEFWSRLQRGEFFSGEFRRVTKQGKDAWIQASYNPILDETGKVQRIVKYASDITDAKNKWASLDSQAKSVNRSFAVIEFRLDGTIVRANTNFLNAMGYSLGEIQGKHHRIFVTEEYARSPEYATFWEALNQGRYHAGEFHRVGKGGRDVYIQASYNPIFGINGEIIAVIKYASDVTSATLARQKTSLISNSVGASVAEMTQTIEEISKNVLSTADLAKNAEHLAGNTSSSVNKLDDGSKTIEKIVEVIRDLADQTNLLALNATIESARAGEAGRGFAVVASEVKDLARQTSDATKSIEDTVNIFKASIDEVVESVKQISNGVYDVSSNMTVISAAVEEQSVTMRSIASTAKELHEIS